MHDGPTATRAFAFQPHVNQFIVHLVMMLPLQSIVLFCLERALSACAILAAFQPGTAHSLGPAIHHFRITAAQDSRLRALSLPCACPGPFHLLVVWA